MEASLIDVANPGVFVRASDVGVPGDITPDALGGVWHVMAHLEKIRLVGRRLMGLVANTQCFA